MTPDLKALAKRLHWMVQKRERPGDDLVGVFRSEEFEAMASALDDVLSAHEQIEAKAAELRRQLAEADKALTFNRWINATVSKRESERPCSADDFWRIQDEAIMRHAARERDRQ